MLTARQARAARAVLGLSMDALAKRSDVSASSIRRIEDGQDDTVSLDLAVRLQNYFEKQGIAFRWDGGRHGFDWPADMPRRK